MNMRVGLGLAAALTAAGLATAAIEPAHASSAWTYNPMTGQPLNFLTSDHLPPDSQAKYTTPFAAYMYGSVIPVPRGASVRLSGPTATFAFVDSTGGHAAWCAARFRSYDLATDSYLGFDGLRHRCVSPF
jgi:hypothetical protein